MMMQWRPRDTIECMMGVTILFLARAVVDRMHNGPGGRPGPTDGDRERNGRTGPWDKGDYRRLDGSVIRREKRATSHDGGPS